MTTFSLKIIAVILMTIDHIGSKISGTPLFLRYIGRLSAQIFFFCATQGAIHTRDRKKYIKRLYLMSVLMCFMNKFVPIILSVFGVEMLRVGNNIFSSILQGVVVIHILEEQKKPDGDKRLNIKYYCFYQLVATAILTLYQRTIGVGTRSLGVLLGCYYYTEGSILLTNAMLVFYFCRNSKKKLAVGYTTYCLGYGFLTVFQIPQKICNGVSSFSNVLGDFVKLPFELLKLETHLTTDSLFKSAFFWHFQWMMIFSLPLILLYNGKRGKGWKKFFYVYYPLHIYVLAIISMYV